VQVSVCRNVVVLWLNA